MNTYIVNKILNDDILFVDQNNNVFEESGDIEVINWFKDHIAYGKYYLTKDKNNIQTLQFKYNLDEIPFDIKITYDPKQKFDGGEFSKEYYSYVFNRKCIQVVGFIIRKK